MRKLASGAGNLQTTLTSVFWWANLRRAFLLVGVHCTIIVLVVFRSSEFQKTVRKTSKRSKFVRSVTKVRIHLLVKRIPIPKGFWNSLHPNFTVSQYVSLQFHGEEDFRKVQSKRTQKPTVVFYTELLEIKFLWICFSYTTRCRMVWVMTDVRWLCSVMVYICKCKWTEWDFFVHFVMILFLRVQQIEMPFVSHAYLAIVIEKNVTFDNSDTLIMKRFNLTFFSSDRCCVIFRLTFFRP